MKKWIAILAIGLTMLSLSATADAARRFGGGLSFGRSAPALQRTAPAPKPALNQPKAAQQNQQRPQQAAPAQAAPKPASPMRGMLMGLAAALGITALAHALGLGEAFTQFLMIALCAMVAFWVIRLLMSFLLAKRMAGAAGAAGATYQRQQRYEEPVRAEPVQAQTFGTQQAPMAGSVLDEMNKGTFEQKTMPLPEGFDVEAFLSVAEKNFVKMQKAWDTGNVTALSEFTSDDVFLAVTHQLRERGAQDYTTEIVTLKSDFRGIVQDGDEYLAGVHFDGTLNVNGEAERVDETWILAKPVNGKGGWLLSGIHQEDQA